MEADLQRFYNVDYRDRWRKGPNGRPLLTLRRVGVLIEHLPAESATARAVAPDAADQWSRSDRLLADVWQQLDGKHREHPFLRSARRRVTTTRSLSPERRRELERARRIFAARRARLKQQHD